ncbi:MAG: hypothetical protein E7645_09485 [Ruminococcaceae bacterium]|nr:hypothetical protein [Oscillospiraceae bacterium]
MIGNCWIGKTNTPRLPHGKYGEVILEDLESAKERITPEARGVMFRKTFLIPENVISAKLNICGLGYYVAFLNGKRVGDYVLDPLETNYNRRVLYSEYDVTDMLCQGNNCIGVVVGKGRYSPEKKYWDWRSFWYGDPCLTAELTCKLRDGSTVVVSTDDTWRTAYGPITFNCFFDGEVYDSRLETAWKEAEFDDSGWEAVLEVPAPLGKLEKNTNHHLKVHRELKPCEVFVTEDGRTLYRFAENISGWTRIELEGPAGAMVRIRHGERVDEGKMNSRSNRHALNRDTFILNGTGKQTYEPSFVLHGFSAITIEADEGVTVHDVTALFVYADVEDLGDFSCDSEEVMKIHDAVKRTQSAALMSFPFDCPQRDERLGWLGDAHVTDMVCMYNFDMRRFYDKWMEDIRLDCHGELGYPPHISPRPFYAPHSIDWASAYPIILKDSCVFYRDTTLVEKHYETLKRYIDFLISEGPILPRTRYGDWQSTVEDFNRGDPECNASFYSYYDLMNFISISKRLGKDVAQYEKTAEAQKQEIRKVFYNSETKVMDDGQQYSMAFALNLGLIPEEDVTAVVDMLEQSIRDHDFHICAGIFGARYIMEALCARGRFETAERLIFQDTFPSWLDMLKGRTTLPEKWNGGASQNHCMFGSVDVIFYSVYAGIKVEEDAIVVDPYYSPRMNRVSAKTFVGKGLIEVEWTRKDDGIHVSIVNNTGEPVFFVNDNGRHAVENGMSAKF